MRIGVVGIGNVMFGDEGIGVHLAMTLKNNYALTHENNTIEFIDGGTLAIALSYILASYDELIILDCIEADDGKIGDVYFFNFNSMPISVKWDGSAHEVEMLQTLQLLEIAGDLPNTYILGIIPNRVEPMSFTLSEQIKNAAKIAEKAIISHIKKLGFNTQKIANLSVQDMADLYAKKGLK